MFNKVLSAVKSIANSTEDDSYSIYLRSYAIYILTKNEIITTNSTKENPHDVLSGLNVQEDVDRTIFGYRKNTPKAYYKINKPQWFVVVDTTKKITAKTINKARFRIILALCIAAAFTLIMVGLYTMYLYINIRQLFKGITAISKGNYDKKIHLIKSMFTPHEIVFLAKEFNYMASKINASYKDLRKKNKKLQKNADRLLSGFYYSGHIRKLYPASVFDLQRDLRNFP
jgi:methyl-accepting chemotaxis protein